VSDFIALRNERTVTAMQTETMITEKIYNALQDDISRGIFKSRMLYMLTRDGREIFDLTNRLFPNKSDYFDVSKKICVYGAGGGARWVVRVLRQLYGKVPFIIDRRGGGCYQDIPIISFEDFLKLPDCGQYEIFVSVGENLYDEVAEVLSRENLTFRFCYKDQFLERFLIHAAVAPRNVYFDLPQLSLGRGEVFVDGGCYNGGTAKIFLEVCPDGKVFAFEPCGEFFANCQKNLEGIANASVYPYGLFDKSETLKFMVNQANLTGSMLCESGDVTVETVALDEFLKDEKVTYIKMNIEGAELGALKGAERIIREQKPKLAICVYHKIADIYELPDLILTYNPDYKFYLRHYNMAYETDTILYAIP
jgi:FkbM family methyltransferase